MLSAQHELSERRQCALLCLTRSNLCCRPVGESAENLRFMQRQGHQRFRHGVLRMMRKMRLVVINQAPNTSQRHPQHKIWPYLLKGLAIARPNQFWCTDIT